MPKRTPTRPSPPKRHVERRKSSGGAPRDPDRQSSIDEKILAAIQRRRKHGVALDDLPRAARLSPAETALLPERLEQLLRTGRIVERKRGRQLVLGSMLGLVSGRLHAHPDGYAFVITDDPDEPDYFIPRTRVRPAVHGDRVLISVERPRGPRREGRIVEVLQRGVERVVGTYHPARSGGSFLRPQDEHITYDVHVPPGRSAGARDGDLVVANIVRYPTAQSDIEAHIAVVLGPASDPNVEIDAVAYRHGLPAAFPEPVLTAAAALPRQVLATALVGRFDLRDRLIVTIDGETARDFDDAIGLDEHAGGFRLWVSIADVSHYVRDGGVVDQEAQARGTSVYFPDRVIPMLPEALSNGICSLNPGVDRLTKTVILDFDRDGALVRTAFHDSVIRSVTRLTYTDVRRILLDRDPETRARHMALVPMLEAMERLCRLLMQRRHRRGSIDFDLPEAEVVLDLTGRPEAIIRAERHIGHQIIEEFMLAANEAVARQLMRHDVPLLHRVHEPPDEDAVTELAHFLATFGLRLTSAPGQATPHDFQRVLAAVAGKPEERLVSTVLLRSMKQARYAAEPLGHFGLATDAYTHFTSPIRRYPDLIVHRLLGELMRTGRLPADRTAEWTARLPGIAETSSRRERIAMDAEREVVALKKVQFMADRIGEELDGFVSGVQPFGCFVELTDYFVEGLVHVSTLTDDYYEYVERAHLLRGRRTHRVIRLGDPVRVRVVAADPERRRIDFQIADTPGAGQPAVIERPRRTQRRPSRAQR